MAKGRKRKPTKLKEFEGNPGKRKLSFEPEIPGLIEKPKSLKKEASELWDKYFPILKELEIITSLDVLMFTALCQQYQIYIDCWNILEEIGYTYEAETKYGYIRKKAPEVGMMNEALRNMHSIAGNFGMTPGERSKLNFDPGKNQDDEMEAMLD